MTAREADRITLDQIADQLVSEAGVADRPGQMDSLLILSEQVRSHADALAGVEALAREWANHTEDPRAWAAARILDVLHIRPVEEGGN